MNQPLIVREERRRVLLAEQHVSNHGEMLNRLSSMFTLQCAPTAIAVLVHLQQEQPDLLIVSAAIPNAHAFPEGETADGSKTVILLIKEIRRKHPGLPVLVYNVEAGPPRGFKQDAKTFFFPLYPTTTRGLCERAAELARNGKN
ncbi:MAG: hypothetical protein V4467_00450 [Patescibacteria group bacterium]